MAKNKNRSKKFNRSGNKNKTKVSHEQAIIIKQTRKRRAVIMLFIFLIMIVSFSIVSFKTLGQIRGSKEEARNSAIDLKKVTDENKKLKNEEKMLDDENYKEQVLKDKFHYSREGEKLYNPIE